MFSVFRVFIPSRVLALLLSESILAVFAFIFAAYIVLPVDPTVWLLYDGGLARIGVLVLTILLGLYFHDLYDHIYVRQRILLVQQLLQVLGISILVQGFVSYVDPEWILPRQLTVIGSLIALVLLFGWRVAFSAVVVRAFELQRLLFLGVNPVVHEITEYLEGHPHVGMTGIGYLAEEEEQQPPESLGPWLGQVSDVKKYAIQSRPDRLVVGMKERRGRMPVEDLLDLRFGGLRIEEASSLYEAICGRVYTKDLRPSQLIYSETLGPAPASMAVQTIYSVVIALAALALLWPFMLAAAILVRLTSKGPALYRQTRVGLNGRPFTIYKFRSMYIDAETRTGAVWASRDDPRITPVGYWMRMLRIDEFPQLFNVLSGDMSVVGPRPERPEFVKVLSEKIPFYRQRHAVKPGLTGWAQINHGYTDTIEDTVVKLEYDLYYIKHITPALDFYIMFHTVKTMLLSRGAH